MPTRALLLSAYIKFINLFPETKATIQEVLRCDSQIRNSDVELQQRAVEYLKLSSIASTDVLVSVDHTSWLKYLRKEESEEYYFFVVVLKRICVATASAVLLCG